ncbi:MAG: succinylglutamate desuccinylase/aspartoacylase family protein [Candidatus Gracilibacteria bacterium]|nr:succinylglutamate desuccinylase/aspartoacylase family protein [Candidatus Gracilibacteria bacterium]
MFHQIINSSYRGVPGITVIDSGKPGKNIAIFAITHGNEPIGLGVFDVLCNQYEIRNRLKTGKIYLVAVNIEAYGKYIQEDDPNKNRFIHDNMNRISNKPHKEGSSEFRRFRELVPILDEIDIAIDLHSVPIGDDIIGIVDRKYLGQSLGFLDAETVLVDDIGNTGALTGYLLRQGKEAYGLECGNHTDSRAFETGVRNVLNLLVSQGVIDGEVIRTHAAPQVFEFAEEIFPETDDFMFIKDYSGFSLVPEGEIFALDGGRGIKNTLGYDAFLGIPMKGAKKGDGAGFLFRRI